MRCFKTGVGSLGGIVLGVVLGLAPQSGSAAAPAREPQSAALAKRASAGAVKVTTVEGITEYRLPNGLHVLMFPDPGKPTITVNITYLVGSRFEQYGETGMAHLLEHLMFKGSTGHRNIPQELTAHGARPNGTTSFDRTNYFETFQASAENLEWALNLEADRMVHSFIAKKDLDSEMTVVRNEFEMGENDPTSILFERVLSTAYLWHNYGHSTIGARSDIENVPIEKLQAFYRTYYQPDNAYLLVAGRFDPAKTLARIVVDFGSIPRPTRKLPRFYTVEPPQDGERTVALRRVGDVQALAVAYHVPSGVHPDSAPLEVLTEVLGDTPSGRLYKALVETKKATDVGSFMPSLHDPSYFMLTAEVRQESDLQDAEKTLLATVDAVVKNPATAEEVARAQAKLAKDIDLTLNSADRVGLEMSEWIGAGDWRLFFIDRDRIAKVTVEDVRRVVAAYLKPSNRTVGTFVPTQSPDRADIPSTPDIQTLVKDYKGQAGVVSGEAFDPSPANIESRTRRFDLPSGLKVALLSKATRGGTVVASMTLRFGDQKSLEGKGAVADLTADMLMRGTTQHTRQQIKDELDKLKARVAISGSATQANVSIETTKENLSAVWKLVAEVLHSPSFPAAELSQLKEENFADIEQEKSDPDAMAQNAYERHMNPYPKGDVRATPTFDESLSEYKAATLDQLKQFYSDYYGASAGDVAIVGDFDEKGTEALLSELFGNWKSARPFTRVPRPYQDVAPVNESLETPDKANGFFIAGMNLPIGDQDPDYSALVLGNFMTGGGFLNSRLAVRIRQKEGLSYGVGSQFQASPLDPSGTFLTFAIYAPQNEAKLEAAFREEIARILKDGFTDQEVKEAKAGYLQARQVSRAQDAQLARTLAQDLYIGRTLSWDEKLEKKIEALSPKEILDAMRRSIDPAKFTIYKAGDFAKAAATKPPAK